MSGLQFAGDRFNDAVFLPEAYFTNYCQDCEIKSTVIFKDFIN